MATDDKPKTNPFNWLLWWRVDPTEVNKQAIQYDELKIWQSARGLSALLLWFSSLITALMIIFLHFPVLSFVDVGCSTALGLCVLGKNRWSKIAAMVYWTLEKVFSLYQGVTTGNGGTLVSQVLFWTVFMHAFYLAYRVERERRLGLQSARDVEVF